MFSFRACSEQELNDFWTQHGTHYQMCASQKLRKQRQAKRKHEETKRAKREAEPSFKIAGLEYTNAGKVKSKARAILAGKTDEAKLEGYEEEFMKFVIGHHERADQKMADFDHFEVGRHPKFPDTRCFFVVRASGEKEDFSMSKCIERMEQQAKDAMVAQAAQEEKKEGDIY